MKRIRSGKGLGDNLYLHSLVGHIMQKGVRLQICTSFRELFPFAVEFDVYSRKADIVCHYISRKACVDTDQYRDCAINAGFPDAPYTNYWKPMKSRLVDDVTSMSSGKPVMLVNGGRWPMDRADGFGNEMLPEPYKFQRILGECGKHFYTVFVGNGKRLFDIRCDLDLNDKTSITDLMNLAQASSALLGQIGFTIPLAEIFDKPLLTIFTGRAKRSSNLFIRQLTPAKLHGKKTSFQIDDEHSDDEIKTNVRTFCDATASR